MVGAGSLFALQNTDFRVDQCDPPLQILDRSGNSGLAHSGARAGGVDQRDSLVGQLAARDEAGRQTHRRDQGVIENADLMVRLQRADETPDHRDRQRLGWFLDLNRLKTPRQGSIFFEVLLILGPSCRRDRAQLAAGKRRLQQVRRIALSG